MERNDANDFGTAGSTGGASTGGNTSEGGTAGGMGSSGSAGGIGDLGGYAGSGLGGASGTTGGSYGGSTGGGYADTAGGSYGTAVDTAGGASTSSTPGAVGAGGAATGASEQHLTDRARDQAAQAREKLGHAGERAREMKRTAEQTLADKLQAGAEKLRQRGTASAVSASTPAYAAAGGATTAPASTDAQLDNLQGNVARGMEATADWLRNGDVKATVEEQARTNPGRTLLVALGVGYLLGKAFRR